MALYDILGIIQENKSLTVFNKTAKLKQAIIEQVVYYQDHYTSEENHNKLYMENSIILEGLEFKIPEHKWGIEYLESLGENSIVIDKALEKLMGKDYTEFNKEGLTKEDCIKMCQKYDETVKKGGKHPLTDDQKKINNANSEKQKNDNKKKKEINNENKSQNET